MNASPRPSTLSFGPWLARLDTGELVGDPGSERLEPKVMELLFLLGSRPNQVLSRDEIMQQLWPGLVVGDDTLARAVSKLRKSLGDDPKSPRYIETIPKRGYRFIFSEADVPAAAVPDVPDAMVTIPAPTKARPAWRWVAVAVVSITLGAAAWFWMHRPPAHEDAPADARELSNRASDYYFQYSRVDNEAAIELFQRVIDRHPDYAPAYAGLSDALVQRVLRWPAAGAAGAAEFTRLGDALRHGHTRTPGAQRQLQRATALAERGVQLDPRSAAAHKALGFVRSVREDFDGALAAYRSAIALDPDAWGPMINIGDVLEISGHADQALPHFESAFAAMSRVYPQQSARIRPWYAETALLIAERYVAMGDTVMAEQWYRKALDIAPLHEQGTAALVKLLRAEQRGEEALALCARLRARVGAKVRCDSMVGAGS